LLLREGKGAGEGEEKGKKGDGRRKKGTEEERGKGKQTPPPSIIHISGCVTTRCCSWELVPLGNAERFD